MKNKIQSLVNVSKKSKNIEKYIEDTSLMNDVRFRATLDNNIELASFILKIVLNKNDLKVDKIKTQESLDLYDNRSVVLDAHAIDSNNVHYNIEMQKAKTLDIIYRARFHLSIMDTNNLKKSNKFSKLPETYIIFFCNFDLFKENEQIYIVDRYVNGKYLYNDLEHIMFINCKNKDTSNDLGKLIHDMTSKIGEKKWYNIFEQNELGGIKKMGQVSEMIRKDGYQSGAKDTSLTYIIGMLKENYSIESISRITKKSKQEILSIKEKNNL